MLWNRRYKVPLLMLELQRPNCSMVPTARRAAPCPPQHIEVPLCGRRGDEVTTLARLPISRAPFCVHHSDYLDLVVEMQKHHVEGKPKQQVASCASFMGRPSCRRFRNLRQRVVKFRSESVTKAEGLFVVERPRSGGFSNSHRGTGETTWSFAGDQPAGFKPIDCLHGTVVKLPESNGNLGGPFGVNVGVEWFLKTFDQRCRQARTGVVWESQSFLKEFRG